jgi:oligopeptidase A
MTADTIVIPDRESLSVMEDALRSMMTRLQHIISQDNLTQGDLIEITSMYNNIGYIFLYLEANDEHVNYERLLPWRDAFHKDPELDRRILALLLRLHCQEPEAEESRLAYINQLREKLQAPQASADAELESLLAMAKTVLADIQQDQVQLLERLGVSKPGANPLAVFYKLSGTVSSPDTRAKLARTWTGVRNAYQPALRDAVDRMVTARRRLSAARGYASVLQRTLERCSVDETDVEVFLRCYLLRALKGHAALEAEIREVLGPVERPMDHFAHYMHLVRGTVKPPLFDLDRCLEYVFTVANYVFDLTVVRAEADSSAHVIAVDVLSGGQEAGRINFDLWDMGGKTAGANHTIGIRNRTDWTGVVQRPVAYVSCRFQGGPGGGITFQNMHSLFHEFGHAINHLLIRKRISNRSGLEYLPLERLEHLSMWFEKWVYHPEFADHLGLTADEHEGLELSRRIKMLEYRRTYAERAVTAALDFEVHRHPEGGLVAAFARLDEEFGISHACELGDFLPYFTWPMFTANPGANFTYLFGAADSSETFTAFRSLSLDEIARRPRLREVFTPCFDFDRPTRIPDIAATFAFYDEGGRGLAGHPAAPDDSRAA